MRETGEADREDKEIRDRETHRDKPYRHIVNVISETVYIYQQCAIVVHIVIYYIYWYIGIYRRHPMQSPKCEPLPLPSNVTLIVFPP
jgi:hypothetical protein